MKPRAAGALYTLAGLCLAAAVAGPPLVRRSWLQRGAVEAAPLPEAPHASTPRQQMTAAGALADEVVATNLFSPRRTAPPARYASDTLVPPPPVPAPMRHVIRLFGIGTTGDGATALLDADPAVPGAEIYHAGDALPGGGRVESIAADHVVIVTSEGRQRLRLPRDLQRATAPVPRNQP